MFKSKNLLGNFLLVINMVSIISTDSLHPPGGGRSVVGSTQHRNASWGGLKNGETAKRRKPAKRLALNCWNCSRRVPQRKLFCTYCSAFVPRSNYFQLFNLKENYSIDMNHLTKNFLNMYGQLTSFKGNENDSLAENYTTYLNDGFSMLKSPFDRGLYMLTLQNMSILENMTLTDQKYCKEIKILKEEITYERTKYGLDKLQAQVDKSLSELHGKLVDSFNRKDYILARQYIVAMEYYRLLNTRVRGSRKLMDQENFGLNLDTW